MIVRMHELSKSELEKFPLRVAQHFGIGGIATAKPALEVRNCDTGASPLENAAELRLALAQCAAVPIALDCRLPQSLTEIADFGRPPRLHRESRLSQQRTSFLPKLC